MYHNAEFLLLWHTVAGCLSGSDLVLSWFLNVQLDSLGLRALLQILINMVILDLSLSLLYSERAPSLIRVLTGVACQPPWAHSPAWLLFQVRVSLWKAVIPSRPNSTKFKVLNSPSLIDVLQICACNSSLLIFFPVLRLMALWCSRNISLVFKRSWIWLSNSLLFLKANGLYDCQLNYTLKM